jgi:KDO2-lipid IV(A) lauroyltransferase
VTESQPSSDTGPRPSLRHRVEYAALRAFAGLVALLGVRGGYALAKCVGSLVHRVDGRHRRVARSNLREHYRDAQGRALSEEQVRRVARDVFRHLATCAVEMIQLPRETRRRGIADIVRVGGREHVEAAAARGKGVVLVTAHVGNWEILGEVCRGTGLELTTVYRPLDNPLLDRWVRATRAAQGQEMVSKRGALRPLLRTLRDGGVVVLLVDQDSKSHGVFAPFFGAPASTIPTPAELALRTGAAIITAFSTRTGPGFRFDAWVDPAVEVVPTGDHEADLLRITTEVNRRVEAAVRRAPEQWLWVHRRWKTKPAPAQGAQRPAGPKTEG